MQLFTTSSLGLGRIKAGIGKRDANQQQKFREKLIEEYDSQHPDPKKKFLWCPILHDWQPKTNTVAAHLFARMHGQDLMDAIFGPMDSPELFSPLNGMIISNVVESVFDKGLFVIVPRLPEDSSPEQRAKWRASDPKEYKVRIIDPAHSMLDDVIQPSSDLTWRDLDGRDVKFRSNFRPRARYLYFHYCLQMLRYAWRNENSQDERLKGELKKNFWGTPGRYVLRNQLALFVEQLGHQYEHLLEGAINGNEETQESVPDEALLVAATTQVTAEEAWEDEDENEEDSNEEDYKDSEEETN